MLTKFNGDNFLRSAAFLRRLVLLAAAAMLLCSDAQAQLTFLGNGRTLADALQDRASSAKPPLTYPTDTSWSKNWIMGGAHAPGRFGSFFRTDLFIMAPCAGASGVTAFELFSLPNGVSGNASQRSRIYTIPAGGFGILPDVVDLFGQTGGSTLYLLVNSSQSTVTTSCRELASWGRTYTQSSTGGEYSTGLLSTFPSITVLSGSYAALTGVQQNSQRRTNVLVSSPYSSGGTVRLFVFDENGNPIGQKDVTVYPYGTTQVALDEFTILPPGGSIRALGLTSSLYWQAQAVTVDNQTNDGFLNSFAEFDF